MTQAPKIIRYGGDTLYLAGSALHPEHNGQTWDSVRRDIYACRDTMRPKVWKLFYRMGETPIYCPLGGDYRTRGDAMYHALAMQAESFR